MIFIGTTNHAATATLSGGSWSSDWPLTKLQSTDLSSVARSSDANNASTIIQWDCGSAQAHDAVAIAAHNMSTAATIKLSLGTSLGGSQVYAGSDVAAYSVTDADRNGISHLAVIPLGSSQTARYGQIEIKDSGNSDGYVQAGYLWAGSGFRPHFNASYGLTDEIVDTSVTERTYGGRLLGNTRRKFRRVSFSFDRLSLAEGSVMHGILRIKGTTGVVLYLPSMSDREACQRYGMVGVMSQLSPLAYPYFKARSIPVRIDEL